MLNVKRWERQKPFDALSWALALKNRKAARAMLERRDGLTWQEASEYAPRTLGWAADLLSLILDRLPPGEEELYCVYRFPRQAGGAVEICAGLLTAAAALDDLPSVELLLSRGYRTGCWEPQPPLLYQIGGLRTNVTVFRVNTITLYPEAPERMLFLYMALDQPDPLAAAVLCGAGRCALRLLEENGGREGLSLACCRALTRGAIPGDESFRPAAEAVTAALGENLADLLEPEDFLDRAHPLFLECLKRRKDRGISRGLIRSMILQGGREEWARKGLAIADPMAVSGCFLELLRTRNVDLQTIKWLFYDSGTRLLLDRNAVPPDLDPEILMIYLQHGEVAGTPPDGELSGLAVLLLNQLLAELLERGRPACQGGRSFLHSGRALALLSEEDHRMITAYLNQRKRKEPYTSHAVSLLLSLLEIEKEEAYVL